MEMLADYAIVEQLREGNHGTVYLANPPGRLGLDDEVVAVKALRQHADEDDFRRVANELRLLHSVESDRIVKLLDAGSDRGRIFFATPYFVEGSLEDAHLRLPEETIRQCVLDAALGVHELHEIGIAHRDIKPANIFVSRDRGIVGELGLAQLVGGGSTSIGAGPLGALEFTAPDIIWGNDASRQSDIWSLGMTLHRSLTGVGALGSIPQAGLVDACRYVLHTRPTVDEGLGMRTTELLERCFAEDPADRYSLATEFAYDLEQTMQQSRKGNGK